MSQCSPSHGNASDLAEYRHRLRHSASHVMAGAVVELFPEAKLAIGPPTDDGFYYDFLVSRPFTPEDLQSIEEVMRRSTGMARHSLVYSSRMVSILNGLPSEVRSITKS